MRKRFMQAKLSFVRWELLFLLLFLFRNLTLYGINTHSSLSCMMQNVNNFLSDFTLFSQRPAGIVFYLKILRMPNEFSSKRVRFPDGMFSIHLIIISFGCLQRKSRKFHMKSLIEILSYNSAYQCEWLRLINKIIRSFDCLIYFGRRNNNSRMNPICNHWEIFCLFCNYFMLTAKISAVDITSSFIMKS